MEDYKKIKNDKFNTSSASGKQELQIQHQAIKIVCQLRAELKRSQSGKV